MSMSTGVVLVMLQTLNTEGWTVGANLKSYDSMETCVPVIQTLPKPDLMYCVRYTEESLPAKGVKMLALSRIGIDDHQVLGQLVDLGSSFTECAAALSATPPVTGTRGLCVDFDPIKDIDALGRREIGAWLRLNPIK